MWAPLSLLLDQWYLIVPLLISYVNEDGGALASYEHVFFLVDNDTILGEDGCVAIVIDLAHTHERCGELIKRICIGYSLGELWQWKLGLPLALARPCVGHSNLLC